MKKLVVLAAIAVLAGCTVTTKKSNSVSFEEREAKYAVAGKPYRPWIKGECLWRERAIVMLPTKYRTPKGKIVYEQRGNGSSYQCVDWEFPYGRPYGKDEIIVRQPRGLVEYLQGKYD